jgi:hypothetical protein
VAAPFFRTPSSGQLFEHFNDPPRTGIHQNRRVVHVRIATKKDPTIAFASAGSFRSTSRSLLRETIPHLISAPNAA